MKLSANAAIDETLFEDKPGQFKVFVDKSMPGDKVPEPEQLKFTYKCRNCGSLYEKYFTTIPWDPVPELILLNAVKNVTGKHHPGPYERCACKGVGEDTVGIMDIISMQELDFNKGEI